MEHATKIQPKYYTRLLIYLFLKIQEKTEKIVNSLDEENMELIKQFDKLSLTLRL